MRLLLVLAMTLCLVATHADASSTVRLEYTGGSSVQNPVPDPFGVAAHPSDLLSFDIVVDLDEAGVGEINFDLKWLDDGDLVLVDSLFEMGTRTIPNNPPTLGDLLTPSAPVAGDGMILISNIGWTVADAFSSFGFNSGRGGPPNPIPDPIGSVFLGSVVFHVGGGPRTELWLGFFDEGSGGTTADGKPLDPRFGHFVVEAIPVPEPGTTSLMLLGLAGLLAAGKRARRSELD